MGRCVPLALSKPDFVAILSHGYKDTLSQFDGSDEIGMSMAWETCKKRCQS